MRDSLDKTLIPVSAACRMFPGRNGKGISRATLWRWMTSGVGRGRVRLDSVKVGGVRYVAGREAIERFIAALNGEAVAVKSTEQSREAERTEKVLLAEGF